MQLWFSEMQTPNVKFSIRVERQLYSGQSQFQRIDVFESPGIRKIPDSGRLHDADGAG